MAESNQKKKRASAVALKYRIHEDEAPIVTARGKGHVAEKIVEIARQSQVPVVRNEKLAEALSEIELQTPIPVEAFRAVAEIYAFLMELDREYAQRIF